MEWLAKIDPSLSDPRSLFFGILLVIAMAFIYWFMGYSMFYKPVQSRFFGDPRCVLRILCAHRIESTDGLTFDGVFKRMKDELVWMGDERDTVIRCAEALKRLERRGLVLSTNRSSPSWRLISSVEVNVSSRWSLTPKGLRVALRK